MAVVWLLSTLDTIRNSALEAINSLIFRSKPHRYSSPESTSKEMRVPFGTPANAPVGSTDTALDLLVPDRVIPTLLDNPHPAHDDTLTGIYSPERGYDAPWIALLRARLRELESTLSVWERSASR
jgi:hypothetical protein